VLVLAPGWARVSVLVSVLVSAPGLRQVWVAAPLEEWAVVSVQGLEAAWRAATLADGRPSRSVLVRPHRFQPAHPLGYSLSYLADLACHLGALERYLTGRW
jgi:hypothetical protein